MTSDNPVDGQFTAPVGAEFSETLEALKAWSGTAPGSKIFYGLTDLDETQLLRYAALWRELPARLRASLLQYLTEASETNIDLDYRAAGMLALEDDVADVRRTAIDLLWEDDSGTLLRRLLDMAQADMAFSVRAAAASALGRFVLAGELGNLASEEFEPLQQILIDIWHNRDEDDAVRRRALESIANCSHAIVPEAIVEAWHSDDDGLRASAAYAMGRSYDSRWEETVLEALLEEDPSLRFEAVRSCGQLEIEVAVPALAQLLRDDDREISEAAIQALGEIGGKLAQQFLEELAEEMQEAEDESLQEVIEDALGNASLGSLDLQFDPTD